MTDQHKHNPESIDLRSTNIQKVCFFSFNEKDALSHLRLIGPARHLGLTVIHGVENGQVFVERAQTGDVILLQRDFPGDIESYEKILAIARDNKIPLVLDIDDLLFELPEDHPDRIKHTFTARLLPTYQALLEADLVSVTTQQLRDYVIEFNQNVTVLPNYLDDKIWQLKTPSHNTNPDGKIVIGYMGGHTHQADLSIILPVLKELIDRYRDKVEIHFWGTEPPAVLGENSAVNWHAEIIWKYLNFASYFQTQTADIFVAPLADSRFNHCKSAIKYLEYGALGVPGVFSNTEPYSSTIQHGANGMLASSPEEWLDSLMRLIEKPDLRISIATQAQADIRSNWLLSDHAALWLSAYQKAHESMPHQASVDSATLKMIRNLSHQTIAMDRFTKGRLKQQRQDIIELKDQVAQRDATISGITNSRTWKLALLFRRIREFIAPPRK